MNYRSIDNDRLLSREGNPFLSEIPLYAKEYNIGDIHVTVVVPDYYHVALPNLGHQMVEYQWNQHPGFFADRMYLTDSFSLLKEYPEYKPDILCFSMSYEGSYLRVLRVLDLLSIAQRRSERRDSDPLIIMGGWAVSRNPLPLFTIADIIGIGDSEHIIHEIAVHYKLYRTRSEVFFDQILKTTGIIAPARYRVNTAEGYLTKWEPGNAPEEIFSNHSTQIARSYYLSSQTDYNDIGFYDGKTFFSIELNDSCASKCAFCASGFRDKVRDIQSPERVVGLALAGKDAGADLVKLFFPANSSLSATKEIVKALLSAGLSPRVGSAKAEKIDQEYLDLVGQSGQEKIAFAPETGDYALRRHLGKPGMTEEILKKVIGMSIDAGIPNLDLYFIMNLPGERKESFQETLDFLGRYYRLTQKHGLKGRFRISAPNFFPKAWTPFQYASAGAIETYEEKIKSLYQAIGEKITITSMSNSVDLMSQNIMSRGGIEAGDILIEVYGILKLHEAKTGVFRPDRLEDWRKVLADMKIEEKVYFDMKSISKPLPWHHIHLNNSISIGSIQKVWEIFQRNRDF